MTDSALATVGGGCFWCIEAAYKAVPGVTAVTSGYAGGDTPDPTYEAVCTGTTGHAEVVQIEYDPDRIDYRELLETFFAVHDPTQLNRQGPDVGSQYRSIVVTHDDTQHEIAQDVIDTLESAYDDEIVTEVAPLSTFYPAEEKHQDFFEKHPDQAYCRMHAQPKVDTVRERFAAESTSEG